MEPCTFNAILFIKKRRAMKQQEVLSLLATPSTFQLILSPQSFLFFFFSHNHVFSTCLGSIWYVLALFFLLHVHWTTVTETPVHECAFLLDDDMDLCLGWKCQHYWESRSEPFSEVPK